MELSSAQIAPTGIERIPPGSYDEFATTRFGVPAGRTPTTHILKPPQRDRPGHVENEHVCLALARELGLAAAQAEVREVVVRVRVKEFGDVNLSTLLSLVAATGILLLSQT